MHAVAISAFQFDHVHWAPKLCTAMTLPSHPSLAVARFQADQVGM